MESAAALVAFYLWEEGNDFNLQFSEKTFCAFWLIQSTSSSTVPSQLIHISDSQALSLISLLFLIFPQLYVRALTLLLGDPFSMGPQFAI